MRRSSSPDFGQDSQAIFTAGFSNLPLERFLANLRTYDIQMIVDVRSRPFAGHSPHFNKEHVGPAVQAAGFDYRYMGRELGGLPEDPGLYDAAGYVRYDRIAAQPWFQRGIQGVLADLDQGRRIALTCGEDDPRHCHRRLLLGRVLRERGIGVAHILADGGLIAEAELLDEEHHAPRQHSLFGQADEPEWKSRRSVLRRMPASGTWEE